MKDPFPQTQAYWARRFGLSPLGVFTGCAVAGTFAVVLLSYALLPDTARNALCVREGEIFYLLGAGLAGYHLKRSYPHATLGLCNIVTLVRLVLVAVLFDVMISTTPPDWLIFAVASVALALDGVDGWLARRQKLVSAFGAQFDVEVDAVFALILALYAATNGTAGIFVILLGLPHYLFWTARLRLTWLNAELPPSFWRKAVCVFQIATLIALQLPFVAVGQLDLMIFAATLALIWSFGRDILWLWRAQAS